MEGLILDLRQSVRWLVRNRTVTVAAVACLALGIGANSTMFGVIDTLLFRPPPYLLQPDRVYRVYFTHTFARAGSFTIGGTSFPNYLDLRSGTSAFSEVAAYASAAVTMGRGDGAVQGRASLCTASLFRFFGVRPALGRVFSSAEDQGPGSPRVAVVSYEFWERELGGRSDAVGSAVWIGDGLYTVVGVAPQGFTGPDLDRVDVWLPIRESLDDLKGAHQLEQRTNALVNVIARLSSGRSPAQAEAQASLALRRGNATDPDGDPTISATLGPIQRERGPDRARTTQISLWAGALSLLVFVIACANVTSLLLALALQRKRECAVRSAMGAGRGRLVRQALLESAMVSILGGGVAVLLAFWAGGLLRADLLPASSPWAVVMNVRGLVYTAAVAFIAAALCGLFPALQASRPELISLMKTEAARVAPWRMRIGSVLVGVQVALSMALLVGIGLFGNSLRDAHRVHVGFDYRKVLYAISDLGAAGYQTPAIDAIYSQVLDRVRSVPGVESAAIANSLPFGASLSVAWSIPGRPARPKGLFDVPYVNAVTPGYFATLGLELLHGRLFTDADGKSAPRVAIVNETMARFYWPGESPLGGCIKAWPDMRQCIWVVGVVNDSRRMHLLREVPTPQWYVPLAQSDFPFPFRALLVRTKGIPVGEVNLVRNSFHEVAPDLPFVDVQPLASLAGRQIIPLSLGTTVFAAFGSLAAVLSALGLFALVAFAERRRTWEIGVRLALGATPREVVWMMVREGLWPAGVGVAVGGLCSLLLGKLLASVLFGVGAYDLPILGAAAVALLAIATVASYAPARRAAEVDPAAALRIE